MKHHVVLFPLTVLLILTAVSYAADDKPQLTGIEIVKKHVEAVGGKEGLAKIKSRVAIGIAKKDSDAAAPVAIMSEAPNRVSAIYQFEGFNWQLTSKDEESTVDFYVETWDFKEVDGVKLPFKLEIVATSPILKQRSVGTITTTISEYRHNIEIDPKMFQ